MRKRHGRPKQTWRIQERRWSSRPRWRIVSRVVVVGLGKTDDPVIFDWATAEDRAVETSDADFGGLLAGAPVRRSCSFDRRIT